MKHFLLRTTCAWCAFCSFTIECFFIFNNSDSKKKIEVVAFLPTADGKDLTPQVILKKELAPDESVEAPFALNEVALDIHWGQDKTVQPQRTSFKPIENTTDQAKKWTILQRTLCGESKNHCHAVLPPSWQLEEDHTGYTVTTDSGEIIRAASMADLLTKIPYRRLVDTFPQEKIIESDPFKVKNEWKKVSSNEKNGNEEIVIPKRWKVSQQEKDSIIITTDNKETITLPLVFLTKKDLSSGIESKKLKIDGATAKKILPYRRKNGVITEMHPTHHLFIVEEVHQKPFKTTQYNLFRRFSAKDAQPSKNARNIPERIGIDHIFEISGTSYETDVTCVYAPQNRHIAAHQKRITLSPREYTEKPASKRSKHPSTWRKKTMNEETSVLQTNNTKTN